MMRFIAIAAVCLSVAACSGPPRLSADIDVSEQTIRPTAAFGLGPIGIKLTP